MRNRSRHRRPKSPRRACPKPGDCRRKPGRTALSDILWLIPGLPLAAAVLVGLFGKWLKSQAHWPVILAAIGSCVVALNALWALNHHSGPTVLLQSSALPWFTAGNVFVDFQLHVDPLAAVMLTAI